MEPLLYSADSEFIRIKNYYRIASAASIAQARARLNSSRRIYPKDTRFPNLFFMFEMAFMNYAERSGAVYEIPELVQTIADSYIAKLPDYSSADIESEIIALLFCKGEEQKRLLKAASMISTPKCFEKISAVVAPDTILNPSNAFTFSTYSASLLTSQGGPVAIIVFLGFLK